MMRSIGRRQFLFGSIGAAAVGLVGGIELERHPSVEYHLGLKESPDYKPPRSDVKVVDGSFESSYMRSTTRWAYAVPTIPPVITLYCLHGKGDDQSTAFDSLRLHDMVQAQRLPIAVAAVDGGADSYWHKRKDGTDAMAMLVNEFLPLMETKLNTSRRAVYGWSMGGYGALLASETYPEVFESVIALSPALWKKASSAAAGAFDNSTDFGEHNVFSSIGQLKAKNLHLACGSDDPFYAATREFAQDVATATADFRSGIHTASFWRSATPRALNSIRI